TGLEPHSYDLVILNSVAQYFPSGDYLRQVLTGAMGLLRPGGHLFAGDLRSLPLLGLHHAHVTAAQARPGTSAADLRDRARAAAQDDPELALDPRWFLAAGLPGVTHLQVLPKYGIHHNELTRFRYDVILHTGPPALAEPGEWLDWRADRLGPAGLREY